MTSLEKITKHYSHGNLLHAITSGVAALGKTPSTVTSDELAAVDEFHVGGRRASMALMDQMGLTATDHVLDVGCGIGGPARFVTTTYGSQVTGIDLTPEYVATGKTLCGWLGLTERVTLQEGSALALPFPQSTFDGAYMIHVGMNIADKAALAAELYRVLRSGARFGIYDIMRLAEGDVPLPVPWAASSESNALAAPPAYKEALQGAGFTIVAERNRRDFALEVFAEMRRQQSASDGPAPLGLHILVGDQLRIRFQNMIASIEAGTIGPVELIAQKQ